MSEKKKPKVILSDVDGDAISVLARCKKAALKAKWSQREINKFTKQAIAGDYDDLLTACMENFDVE